MNKIEGKIILQAENLTPRDILDAEEYINNTLASILYANKHIALRVHMTPYQNLTPEEVLGTFYKEPSDG